MSAQFCEPFLAAAGQAVFPVERTLGALWPGDREQVARSRAAPSRAPGMNAAVNSAVIMAA